MPGLAAEREDHGDVEAAIGPGARTELRAVRGGDGAHDGQPESQPVVVPATYPLVPEPLERLEAN
jgi:hypothetical protein